MPFNWLITSDISWWQPCRKNTLERSVVLFVSILINHLPLNLVFLYSNNKSDDLCLDLL